MFYSLDHSRLGGKLSRPLQPSRELTSHKAMPAYQSRGHAPTPSSSVRAQRLTQVLNHKVRKVPFIQLIPDKLLSFFEKPHSINLPVIRVLFYKIYSTKWLFHFNQNCWCISIRILPVNSNLYLICENFIGSSTLYPLFKY